MVEITEKIVLNWMNVKPVFKKYNSKKHKKIDVNQCKNHLETLLSYKKVRKLKLNTTHYEEILSKFANGNLRDTLLRETPKASTTTLIEKSCEGTRLVAVPNGNNVDDEE